jgi:SH3-like domain-containing protein
MPSNSVPRLGLLARLGLGGALGVAVLAVAISVDIRLRRDGADGRLTRQAAIPAPTPAKTPVKATLLAKPDAIGALLGGAGATAAARQADSADTTGSLPPDGEPAATGVGPVSGLPMPRFVSLKTDRVNVRQGPTRDQSVSFIFQKVGLPVEVTAEFENWRRVRDSEGSEGWVLQSLLSGRRTALVAPWLDKKTLTLLSHADPQSAPVALLEPGVMASIKACAGDWCRIAGTGFDGWIEQQKLWGTYPGETID